MQIIASRQNPIIQRARKLRQPKYRREQGLFLLEGPRLLQAALDAGVSIEEVFLHQEWMGKKAGAELTARLQQQSAGLYAVKEALLAALATTESPPPLVAVARVPRASESGSSTLSLAVDELQDPGNLGTLLRSAAAAGCGEALLGPGTVDPFGPKVLRSAMGGVFLLRLQEVKDLAAALRERQRAGAAVVATVPGGVSLWQARLPCPAVLLVGNEARGIGREIAGLADLTVGIPLAAGVESLNAAVAGSLCLFEWKRRRETGEGEQGNAL